MILKIAWRNVWRNKRRSFITIASILFAVFFAVVMRSMQLGVYERMIDSVVGVFSGYIQLHEKGYNNDKTIENSFVVSDSLIAQVKNTNSIQTTLPRLESFALVSNGNQNKGALIIGMDPKTENEFLNIPSKLIEGSPLQPNDQKLMIGTKLAQYFNVHAGDTLLLIGQGYHAISAAGKYEVACIVDFKNIAMNQQMAFLPLSTAQYLFSAPNRATSLVVHLNNANKMQSVQNELVQKTDTAQFEILNWEEMMPELVQTIEADSGGGLIMVFILYMIISFGIFGTVIMMTKERQYEFGVLLSVGMKRLKMIQMLLIELFIMAVIGIGLGIALAYPIAYYYHVNPIPLTGAAAQSMEEYGFEPAIMFSIDSSIPISHGLAILIITAIISIYPALVIAKLKPVDAMHL